MEIVQPYHAREVVRRELAGRLLADLFRMATVFGPEAPFRLLGRPAPAIPGQVPLTVEGPSHQIRLEDIDVDQLPVGRVVMAMYDYAFEQHAPVGVQLFEFRAEVEHVEDLALSLESNLLSLFMSDPWHMGDAAQAQWRALPDLCSLVAARLRLDMGEILTLRDLALLADMNERSVRNALTAAGEARLIAERSDATDSYWVENDQARRWLSSRRGFVPTRFENLSAIPGEHPDSINSLFELGSYIHQRWVALGKTPKSVCRELEWPGVKFDYLNSLTANPQQIDPRDCGDLARSLLVSEAWFTTQVMRNLFPHQVELLLDQPQQEPAPERRSAVGHERVCSRVRFVLHDGTELFPIKMKNRQTGAVAFRLSRGGAGGNTIENTIEVDDEDQMIEMVCRSDMAVRLASADGKRQGLYRRSGRSVRCVDLDGTVL